MSEIDAKVRALVKLSAMAAAVPAGMWAIDFEYLFSYALRLIDQGEIQKQS